MSVRTRTRAVTTTAVVAALLGAFLTGCSGAEASQEPGDDVPRAAASGASGRAGAANGGANEADPGRETAGEVGTDEGDEADHGKPEAVRDAFAGLQATLGETCTPGSAGCAYLLGRVNDELSRLERAMTADSQGSGHFEEPLAWIKALHKTLNGDAAAANPEKHRSELLGTRDRINTWMQGHPEDYR
ncbi:hypothetical protein [Streptomyces sp. NPDC052042]|uniref:hypothetical protein n=1 Tax=Streptomyces sp. NPDC052042 TaxID=3365683 RepID=UPI0037CFFEA8